MMKSRGFRQVRVWVSGDETAAEVAEVLRRQKRRPVETDLADALLAAFEAR
jgi:hypothetical protein